MALAIPAKKEEMSKATILTCAGLIPTTAAVVSLSLQYRSGPSQTESKGCRAYQTKACQRV